MKYKRLTMTNWRCFRGTESVEFSTDPNQTVTVVFATNGSGKTSMMNAFLWCLFGPAGFTANFDDPDKLLNTHVQNEMGVGEREVVRVQLEVQVGDATYEVTRSQHVERRSKSNWVNQGVTVKCDRIAPDHEADVDMDVVTQALPHHLKDYFFFSGESLTGRLAERASVKDALRGLLGVNFYEKAHMHLGQVAAKHANNAPVLKDTSKQELVKEQTRLVGEREQLTAHLGQLESEELPAARILVEDRRRALEQLGTEAEQASRLAAIGDAIDRAKTSIQTARVRLAELMGGGEAQEAKGHIPFLPALLSDTLELIAKHSDRIPPPVRHSTAVQMLHDNLCVCDRPLPEGSDEYRAISAIVKRTAEDSVADRAADLRLEISRALGFLDQSGNPQLAADAALNAVDEVMADVDRKKEEIRHLEAERKGILSEVEEGLDEATLSARVGAAHEAAARAETGVEQLEDAIQEARESKQKVETRLQELDVQIGEEAKNDRRLARHRAIAEMIENTQDFFREFTAISADCKRHELQDRMQALVDDLLISPLEISVSEDFQLTYRERSEGDAATYALGDAEKAMITLAFVAAVSNLIPDPQNPMEDALQTRSRDVANPHAVPIVLDAPYSPFDGPYLKVFSEKVGGLLPQVVIFVRSREAFAIEKIQEVGQLGSVAGIELKLADGSHLGADSEEDHTLIWQGRKYPYITEDGGESRWSRVYDIASTSGVENA